MYTRSTWMKLCVFFNQPVKLSPKLSQRLESLKYYDSLSLKVQMLRTK